MTPDAIKGEAPPALVSFKPRDAEVSVVESAHADTVLDPSDVAFVQRSDKSLILTIGFIYVMTKGFFDEADRVVNRVWKCLIKKGLGRGQSRKVLLLARAKPETLAVVIDPHPDTEIDVLMKIILPDLPRQSQEFTPYGNVTQVAVETDSDGIARFKFTVNSSGVLYRPSETPDQQCGKQKPSATSMSRSTNVVVRVARAPVAVGANWRIECEAPVPRATSARHFLIIARNRKEATMPAQWTPVPGRYDRCLHKNSSWL